MHMRTLLFIVFFLIPSVSFSNPLIQFFELKKDLGIVRQSNVEHFFEFRNSGDQELVINKMTAS